MNNRNECTTSKKWYTVHVMVYTMDGKRLDDFYLNTLAESEHSAFSQVEEQIWDDYDYGEEIDIDMSC
jgi:hypothetical protein